MLGSKFHTADIPKYGIDYEYLEDKDFLDMAANSDISDYIEIEKEQESDEGLHDPEYGESSYILYSTSIISR